MSKEKKSMNPIKRMKEDLEDAPRKTRETREKIAEGVKKFTDKKNFSDKEVPVTTPRGKGSITVSTRDSWTPREDKHKKKHHKK